MAHFYFDLVEIKKRNPDFEWRGYPYYAAGADAWRRNVISYEEWSEAEQWGKEVPELFQFGDQGILNYLVFFKSQRDDMPDPDVQHLSKAICVLRQYTTDTSHKARGAMLREASIYKVKRTVNMGRGKNNYIDRLFRLLTTLRKNFSIQWISFPTLGSFDPLLVLQSLLLMPQSQFLVCPTVHGQRSPGMTGGE